jgi:hypothetical protein
LRRNHCDFLFFFVSFLFARPPTLTPPPPSSLSHKHRPHISTQTNKNKQTNKQTNKQVEERDVHEYEGEGVGRRESLRPAKPAAAATAAAKKADEGEEEKK